MHVRTQLYVHEDPEWQLHIWFVMGRLSTVTLILKKYTIYNMLLNVLIFQSNDDSALIKAASHTQALYMHILIRRITMNLPSVYLLYIVKRENNEVSQFFKMISIVQMMYIEEIIFIPWEFSMIISRVEWLDRVAQFNR